MGATVIMAQGPLGHPVQALRPTHHIANNQIDDANVPWVLSLNPREPQVLMVGVSKAVWFRINQGGDMTPASNTDSQYLNGDTTHYFVINPGDVISFRKVAGNNNFVSLSFCEQIGDFERLRTD